MLKILTLNWNGKEKLEKLYPTLISSLNGLDYEWHIKDNASKDDSIEYIRSQKNTKVNIINYPHNNDSFAYGCNFLFKESSPAPDDFVLLLNNDIVFNDKTSLSKMISIFNDNRVGVVGAKLKFTDTNKIQHAGVVFNTSTGFPVHFKINENDDKSLCKNREFQAVTGAVWLTKAKFYENICRTNNSGLNGLDENFIWAFEDISACLTIKYEMKKKIVCCNSTDICHDQSYSLNKNSVYRFALGDNIKYFRKKWFGKYIVDDVLYAKNTKYNLYKQK